MNRAARHLTTSPLIGRTNELNHLQHCWQRARSGEGNAVVISGEPGIGKSRLAFELEAHALADEAIVLRFQCSQLEANHDLHPVRDHLRRLAGVRRAEAAPLRSDKIRRMLARSTARAPPEGLVSSLMAIGAGAGEVPGDLDPHRRRDDVLHGLADGIAELSRIKPLLMIVEDAQWLDPTSRKLVEDIVRHVQPLCVLVVVTARRDFDPSWLGDANASIVIPRRLRHDDALAMARNASPAASLSTEELRRLAERSEGVPLVLEELVKGRLAADARPPDVLDIPARLQALIGARLEALGVAQRVAQVGAALGRRFSHQTCATVCGGDTAVFAEMIAALMTADILLPKSIGPDNSYTFRHTLLQEATYASLLPAQRVEIHGRILAAMQFTSPDLAAEQPEIMAHHADCAGQPLVSASYWLAAGQDAAKYGAVIEAVNCFRLGLEAAHRSPDGTARRRVEFELNLNLGPALMALKGYASDEGLAAFTDAEALLASSQSSLEETHVLLGLFNVHFGRAEFAKALEVARRADYFLTVGYGGYPVMMGQAQCMMGNFVDARDSLERAIAKYDPTLDEGSGLFAPANVVATSFLAKVEFALGNLDRAAALTKAAMDLARQRGHPVALAITYLGELFLAAELGDFARADLIASDALAHCMDHHLENYALWVAFHRAALGLRTNPGLAIATMQHLIAEADASGTRMFRPAQLGLLGAAFASTGKGEEALLLFDEALTSANDSGGLEPVPALHRLRAKTLAATSPAEALRELQTSLAIARQQSARIEELRSATQLARMLKGTDRQPEAQALLAGILGKFTEGHEFPDLKQAKRVLASLAAGT